MSDDNDPDEQVDLTWYEREMMSALRRVANARSQLQALGGGPSTDPLADADPADLAAATELHAEIQALQPKAASRFGGGGARKRIAELEGQLRLVLDRLGVDDVAAVVDRGAPPEQESDPALIEFAQRELAQAEEVLAELMALDVPEPEPRPEPEPESEPAEVTEMPRMLRPPAAS